MMKLWRVGMRNKETGVKIHLSVPAATNEEATRQLVKMDLFGIEGAYEWLGTGPAYDKDYKRMVINAD